MLKDEDKQGVTVLPDFYLGEQDLHLLSVPTQPNQNTIKY